MRAVNDCTLSELPSRLSQPLDYLVVSASYEERAYGVCEKMAEHVRGKVFVCHNENHISYLRHSVERFKSIVRSGTSVPLNSDRPLTTFNALRQMVENLGQRGVCHVGVDVTCFTREAMSILAFLLNRMLPQGSIVTGFYQKAERYGRSRKGGWLTEGVREVRTILGYTGSVSLAAETHLVILPGFEHERAQEIVDAVQPARISLGHAIAEKSISLTLNLDHDNFMRRLEALYLGPSFDRFEFSCIDPFETAENIAGVLRTSRSQNVVIACLNTKPAMFGVCVAALLQPSIQLIYAQPHCYNINDYSRPMGEVISFTTAVDFRTNSEGKKRR